jgi:hypothetical protein
VRQFDPFPGPYSRSYNVGVSTSAPSMFRVYFGRIREFQRADWVTYCFWVGAIAGQALASALFLMVGGRAGARFPSEAYLVPLGASLFTVGVGVDVIGHLTVYKEVLRGGEALLHNVISLLTGLSCLLLVIAFPHRTGFAAAALVATVLVFVYSLLDEVMHWRRYVGGNSDVIEMASHVVILAGHGIMMLGWWHWYYLGYGGVSETLRALGLVGGA